MTELAVIGFDAHIRDLRHMEARAAADLADWLVHLKVKRYSDRTVYGYSRVVARLLRKFPDKEFSQFTDTDIEEVLLESGERSGHIDRSIFNHWFRWGYVKRRIPGNPVDRVAQIRHPHRRPTEIFSEAEVGLLEGLPFPDGALFTILFGTGIRRGEARKLRRDHVDLNRTRLMVYHGKGDKDRVVGLPPSVLKVFADIELIGQVQRDEYLWSLVLKERNQTRRYRTHPIGDTTFEKWYSRCIEAAGVRYLNPHTTRHTYGWRLRGEGLDLEERALLMGHESSETTKRYYGRLTVDDVMHKIAAVDW
jgi:integrase/recombinase XerD